MLERVKSSVLRVRAALSRLIAPKAAHSVRTYASARPSRLTAGWQTTNSSADSELTTSLRDLRARSRALVRDASYAKRAKRIIQNNVIGSGIGLQARVKTTRDEPNERVNEAIEEAFEAWSCAEYCHTGGSLHFADIERAAMGQVFECGEVFIRKHLTAFGGSTVPLALELIEAERIADDLGMAGAPGRIEAGAEVRMGVEVDRFYRPIAYWIRERHPSEVRVGAQHTNRYERVPADQILHLRIIDRWPQTRGEPWLHTVVRRLNDMDGYSEAEIVAARGAASYMATIETPNENIPLAEKKDDGTREFAIEPGISVRLAAGEKMNFISPNRPNPNMDPFMRMMLRECAAGADVSYESLSRDYSQSNYSSSRLALLDDRDLWRVYQQWFLRSFRVPLHRIFLQQAILAAAIPVIRVDEYALDPAKFEAVRFKPRGWTWIDPTKEVEAFAKAVRNGFTTVEDVIAKTGDGADLEDVLEARRQELDDMKALNLEFDTDPARLPDGKIAAQVGSALAAQQAGPDAGAGGTDGATPSDPAKPADDQTERLVRAMGDAMVDVVRNMKAPTALISPTFRAGDVHLGSTTVNAPISVQPTPVTVENKNRIEVQPTPITVENQNRIEVQPTPITVENQNRIEVQPTPVTIENQNRIEVQPTPVTVESHNRVEVQPTPVTVESHNHVEVGQETETETSHERDEAGELVKSRARTRVVR